MQREKFKERKLQEKQRQENITIEKMIETSVYSRGAAAPPERLGGAKFGGS
jgi:hypothetical protein